MNTNAPRGFDKLFTKSVPHILEKIFLSLDYASFNNCQEVCNEWKAFLGSEQFNRRAKYVYLDEILEIKWEERDDEENLTTYSMEGNVEEVQNERGYSRVSHSAMNEDKTPEDLEFWNCIIRCLHCS